MGLAPNASAFFSRVSPQFSADDLVRLRSAWALAQVAHSGQLRQSGEPYAMHPLVEAFIFARPLLIGCCQQGQQTLGFSLPFVSHECCHMEATDHRPETAIVVLVG